MNPVGQTANDVAITSTLPLGLGGNVILVWESVPINCNSGSITNNGWTLTGNLGSVSDFMVRDIFLVESFGSVLLSDLSMPENLDDVFGPGTYAIIETPNVIGGNAVNATGNPNFDGSGVLELFAPGSSLDVGEFVELTILIQITMPPDTTTGPATFTNQGTVSGMGPNGNPVDDDSNDGMLPDGNGNGDPRDDSIPTVITLPIVVPILGTWSLVLLIAGLMILALWRRQ